MVVKKEESKSIVFDYNLKEFPLVVSKPASDFVNKQENSVSDFKVNELIAEQSGMSEMQRKSIEAKVEEMALVRLKEIEERAYKEAYDLGKIEGANDAFEERKAELVERIGKFDELLATFDDIKMKIMKENEAALIKLLYSVAEKIALKEIEKDKENIIHIIMQLIEDVQSDEKMVLYVSEDDADFIESLVSEKSKEVDILKRVKLEKSQSIQAGGCSLETNYGTVDASIEQRVERVWLALQGKTPRLTEHSTNLKVDEPKDEPSDDEES